MTERNTAATDLSECLELSYFNKKIIKRTWRHKTLFVDIFVSFSFTENGLKTVLTWLNWSCFCFVSPYSSPVQWDVPQTPSGPLRPPGGALHRPDGVVHRSVHPPRLRAGDLAVSQVRARPPVPRQPERLALASDVLHTAWLLKY